MKKDKISRRDFLKFALTSMGAFLASCMPRVTQTLMPSLTPSSTKTSTPEPTLTDIPTSTPTGTPIPMPTEFPCFRLLSPESGAKLPAVGKVTFSWESMERAVHYQIQFTYPSGQIVSFDTENTNSTRYIESFLAGGNYTWRVTAFDSNGTLVCITELFTFEKPAYIRPQNNGGGDDGGGDTVGSVVGTTIGD